MSQLMFRCPYTNKPIRSGIDLVADILETVADYPISLQCQHCGRRHHGTVGDGSLIEEPAPPLAPQS
jgi:hypothetical protein